MTVTNKRFLALRASASVASSTRQRDVCMYASLWGDRWCGLHDSWIRVWWRHDEVLAVPSAYFVCLVVWPWVTNRSCDDVPGRSEQFLHCGCDGAGREQQPTSLLPTWGTKAHVQTDTHTHRHTSDTSDATVRSGHDEQHLWKKRQAIISGYWTADCESAQQVTDLIFLAWN